MAMGSSKSGQQDELWIDNTSLPNGPGHAFYDALNTILDAHGFDNFAEKQCAQFYAETMGRPGLAPGVYFRMLLAGYFEGIDAERGIAWRFEDSLTLRRFINYPLSQPTPDHSTLSRTRHRIDLATHQTIFDWVLTVLAKENLLKGKTLGIDATTLEANAALRSIVRRDTGESYDDFLDTLAKESGIETPSREDRSKIDKNRKGKGSNKDWESPSDPDSRITKMKDGRTHLAHKAEHAVDMETGAIAAVTLQGADQGDTTTVKKTVASARQNLSSAASDGEARKQMKPLREIVCDKGYHGGQCLVTLQEEENLRTYTSEPKRGRRKWKGKQDQQEAIYANRRRISSERGQSLMRKRGEIVERSFAHVYDTGGMRRSHLCGHDNILKRLVVHTAGFNLSLVLRKKLGKGTPRGLQGTAGRSTTPTGATWSALLALGRHFHRACGQRHFINMAWCGRMGGGAPITEDYYFG